MSPLLEVCKSQERLIKRSAISCLAAITESSKDKLIEGENHVDMKRRDLVDMLISSMDEEATAIEIQDECAFALSNLAKDCNLFAES